MLAFIAAYFSVGWLGCGGDASAKLDHSLFRRRSRKPRGKEEGKIVLYIIILIVLDFSIKLKFIENLY